MCHLKSKFLNFQLEFYFWYTFFVLWAFIVIGQWTEGRKETPSRRWAVHNLKVDFEPGFLHLPYGINPLGMASDAWMALYCRFSLLFTTGTRSTLEWCHSHLWHPSQMGHIISHGENCAEHCCNWWLQPQFPHNKSNCFRITTCWWQHIVTSLKFMWPLCDMPTCLSLRC